MFKGAAVVMGVTGCGKTRIGEALARTTVADFIEGDALHPAANIAKMSAGIALNDEDRWPWLERIGHELAVPRGAIASCSALKRVYRERLAEAAGRPVFFVYLRGDRELLAARLVNRKGHFMPPALLDSQLAALECPGPDESAIAIDVAVSPAIIVARAAEFLMSASKVNGAGEDV